MDAQIDKVVQVLPPEIREQVRDYIEFLLKKSPQAKSQVETQLESSNSRFNVIVAWSSL